MNIRKNLKRALRAVYLGVVSPFRVAGRILYRSTRGFALGIRWVGRFIVVGTVDDIRAISRGVQWVFRRIGSATAAGVRSAVNGTTKVLHNIIVGYLSLRRAILIFMHWILQMISTGAMAVVRLAVAPFIAVYRGTGHLTGLVRSFIGAKCRAIVFNLASTTMTLSLDDGTARLLVLKGNRIIAWRSGQIGRRREEPATAGDTDSESGGKSGQPVLNPLKAVLEDLPARSRKVVTDLPLYVPLLRHVPLPEVKGRDLKRIVNAEVLNSVPFGEDEVYIRWQIEEGRDTKEASVIAIPKGQMDEQVEIVHDSQLSPSAIFPKATALAAAVGRPDVFILHMTGAQTAVVLVRKGVPRIVHRLELPQNTAHQAETIAMGVAQVAGYHRSQRPDDDVSEIPVVITGEVGQMGDLIDLLATSLDRPLLPFEPNVGFPEGFDPAEFASNIGLFLSSRSKQSARLITAQNVLPERHSPRRFPVAATAVFAGLLALGYFAFNLTGIVSDVAGDLGPLEKELNAMDTQARENRLTVARQRVLNKQIADIDLESMQLEASLLSLKQEMDTLLSQISDITGNADSSSVEISQLVPLPNGFSVSGSAVSHSDVLEFAASMRTSPNFDDAMVVQVAESGGSEFGFTVQVIFPLPGLNEAEESGPQAQNP